MLDCVLCNRGSVSWDILNDQRLPSRRPVVGQVVIIYNGLNTATLISIATVRVRVDCRLVATVHADFFDWVDGALVCDGPGLLAGGGL